MQHSRLVTWVVVANGARAHIFQPNRKGNGLHEALPIDFLTHNLPTRSWVSDRPGVAFDRTGCASRAMAPRSDAHREEKRQFVRILVAELAKGAEAGAYRRLILVAPPQTLGDLREALPPRVRLMVRAEVPKDLTQLPTRVLFRKLAGTLGR